MNGACCQRSLYLVPRATKREVGYQTLDLPSEALAFSVPHYLHLLLSFWGALGYALSRNLRLLDIGVFHLFVLWFHFFGV